MKLPSVNLICSLKNWWNWISCSCHVCNLIWTYNVISGIQITLPTLKLHHFEWTISCWSFYCFACFSRGSYHYDVSGTQVDIRSGNVDGALSLPYAWLSTINGLRASLGMSVNIRDGLAITFVYQLRLDKSPSCYPFNETS